jgi:hypothetical protein
MSVAPPANGEDAPEGRMLPIAVAVLTAGALALRRFAAAAVPEQLDSIAFVHSLARYSLAASAPHWPGYPVYYAAAKLAAAMTRDPVAALHQISIVSSAATQVPLMLLAAAWARRTGGSAPAAVRAAIAAGLAWTFVLVANTTGTEIISDPMGAATAVTLLWLSWSAYERGSGRRALIALVLAGVLPGIRLPAWTLTGPAWLSAWYLAGRRDRTTWSSSRGVLAVLVPVLAWAGWEIGHEGGAFVRVGWATASGHLRTWGGSIFTDRHPFRRPGRMVETFSTFGIGGWAPGAPWPRIFVTMVLGALALVGTWRLVRSARPAALFAACWIVPYVAYHFLLHTVDLPRYQLVPVALACLLAGIGVPRSAGAGIAASVVLVAALGSVTIPAARVHGRVPPVEYQFAAYCSSLPPGSAVLMPESSTVLETFTRELAPDIAIFPWAEADPRTISGRRQGSDRPLYSTEPDPDDPNAWRPVAHFCSEAIFDGASLSETWLFRYEPGSAADSTPLPACARTESLPTVGARR